jgi:hypothetical protein
MSMTTTARDPVLTGGCQCGAVRYALYAEPTGISICHCRMCQKAVGNYFAAFAGVKRNDFAWTRGKPGAFRSSEVIERDFCRDCGTPLTYRALDNDRVSVSVGSLDQPDRVHPKKQFGLESRHADFEHLSSLPGATTDSWAGDRLGKLATRQHPDHETTDWKPPTGGASE